ncbi:hypothetical protein NIM87_02370 [Devosia sp. XJ19-1]|uniref:Uncharacterized protein n=1 Tax=Devosia ureilytica TaxID=2952754 RepID=A0A9Q4FR29_9HYPH|nr:hypothetical protein [Devosia ureilytica]MCP8882341.1 hypothetical protein [Devosia ureilytica]MCP8885772.1 hypothetical protein [Devosia ureilytica]
MTKSSLLGLVPLLALAGQVQAHEIATESDPAVHASFDIVDTRVTTEGDEVVFAVKVRGEAGDSKPDPRGEFAGSEVYAYVWPTSIDSGDIGFDAGQGIVAMAVTFHPDFDDAAYGGTNRHIWHPHWVVLVEDAACGGGLTVKDIPAGTTVKTPPTWPKVPILIDSPDYPLDFTTDTVEIRVPLAAVSTLAGASFDGVTAGLKVNANLHAPLLCVDNVFKTASGDLSLPGKVMPAD